MTVFKAHITTNPASDVLDMFWIYDNRHELPDHHRCERTVLCLGWHASLSAVQDACLRHESALYAAMSAMFCTTGLLASATRCGPYCHVSLSTRCSPRNLPPRVRAVPSSDTNNHGHHDALPQGAGDLRPGAAGAEPAQLAVHHCARARGQRRGRLRSRPRQALPVQGRMADVAKQSSVYIVGYVGLSRHDTTPHE